MIVDVHSHAWEYPLTSVTIFATRRAARGPASRLTSPCDTSSIAVQRPPTPYLSYSVVKQGSAVSGWRILILLST